MAREKPFTHNAMADLLKRTQLDVGGLDRYAPSGAAIDVPNFFHGTTTDPVVVSLAGRRTYMKYVRQHNLVTVFWEVWFGAGSTFGSGTWYLTMPVVSSSTSFANTGQWAGFSTGGTCVYGFINLSPSTNRMFLQYNALIDTATGVGTNQSIAPLAPWSWSANGLGFTGSVSYYAQDLYNP